MPTRPRRHWRTRHRSGGCWSRRRWPPRSSSARATTPDRSTVRHWCSMEEVCKRERACECTHKRCTHKRCTHKHNRPGGRGRRAERGGPVSPFRGSVPFTDEWRHFRLERAAATATVTFTRPDKLNALTFAAYADLRDLLAELPHRGDTRALVLRGEGKAFCSGGDVNEIIGETLKMRPDDLLAFTRMTGDVVKAMRECPIPIIAAVHGTAAGAGAVLALAADFRLVARSARFAFLFTKVGLSGADMGAAY